MSRLNNALVSIAKALDDLQSKWALVGGLAVSARAEPRFTRNVDVAVAAQSDLDAEQLVYALTERGFRISATVEQTNRKRLATVRLRVPEEPTGGIVVDILFASSGIEPEVVAAAEKLEILPQLFLPVATTVHLVALKVLAADDQRRPQDRADVLMLLQRLGPPDFTEIHDALRCIEQRGFHRGKDLQREFQAILSARS